MHVTAVVVAYNRRELLTETLRALLQQTRPVDSILVVDNASSDGSADAATAVAPSADVLRLPRNTGGSGGFAVGISRAVRRHGADWVWLMDDDTVPTATALAELLAVQDVAARPAAKQRRPLPELSLLASRVVWTDGRDHPMNTPRRHPFASPAVRQAAEGYGAVPVRSASFVSALISAAAVHRAGLPIANFFIWNDDFEYTTRLLRNGAGLYCPQSVVVHKTKQRGSTDLDPGERFYYEVRNKVWLFRHSPALALPEKAVYGGSTLLRWLRTFRGSANRQVLSTQLRRGLADGMRHAPLGNAELLADLAPDVAADVAALDVSVPKRARDAPTRLPRRWRWR